MLTPTAAVHSGPSWLFLLPTLPAAAGENRGHGTLQIPWPLMNTSLFMKVMTKPSKTFFAAPSWVTCFLSSTISLMRLFHKEKNKIKYQGVRWKGFLCSEAQGKTAGANELLDQRRSCWENTPCPPLFPFSLPWSPLKSWKRFSYANTWIGFKTD